jgi:hypothetical protein
MSEHSNKIKKSAIDIAAKEIGSMAEIINNQFSKFGKPSLLLERV